MAARWLILCILLVGSSFARGEVARPRRSDALASDGRDPPARRAVAVIDLTNDQAVRDMANKLLELLASHAELAPPAISDGAALVDKPPADDELRIAGAQKKRQAAEQNLAQRNFREAAIDAVEGQELLLHVTPRAAISLYADLALALGQSRLGEKKGVEARDAFALTYRLDPHRTLDDLHYLPEVVKTFEAAKQPDPGAGVGTIAVRGAGRVWIDGQEVGSAPGAFQASYGRHVVWLTGLLRETGGKEVMVTQERPGDATIMDGPLSRPQKVIRYRMALAQAQDPAARASAMMALATFVNVHEAVLLSLVNGKLIWQAWRDRAPGFSALRELKRDGALEILKSLAPPAPVDDPDPPALHVPLVVRHWYQEPRVQLGLVATVVVAVIGGVLWARYVEPPRSWDPDIKSLGHDAVGR
jgi:hypothetical protein